MKNGNIVIIRLATITVFLSVSNFPNLREMYKFLPHILGVESFINLTGGGNVVVKLNRHGFRLVPGISEPMVRLFL